MTSNLSVTFYLLSLSLLAELEKFWRRSTRPLDQTQFIISNHSFKPGGAPSAANLHVPDRLFKVHGRWKSDSGKHRYIRDKVDSRLFVPLHIGILSFSAFFRAKFRPSAIHLFPIHFCIVRCFCRSNITGTAVPTPFYTMNSCYCIMLVWFVWVQFRA